MGTNNTRRCPLLLFLLYVANLAYASRLPVISFKPSTLNDLTEDQTRRVNFYVHFDCSSQNEYNISQMGDKIDLVPSNPGIIQPYPDNFILPKVDFANCVDGQLNYVGIVEVTGRRVGLETIHTSFASSKSIDGGAMPLTLTNETLTPLDLTVAAETLDIRCLKSGHDERLEKVFIGLLVIIISLATVLFGSAIDLDIVWKTIKLPIGPCIGLFTQFFIMPAIATGIAYMIFIPRNEFAFALGIFITACAPGGGASNYWTLLLKGNANLSVSMTFFSNIASLVMMPFWIGLMSDRFVSPYGEQVELKTPFKKIIYSLLSMIIPLVIGVALARKFEGFKTKARQIVRPFLIFVLVFLIGFGCISSTYIFRIMSWNVVLGAALLPFFGFMFGCFTAIVCGQSPENVTAIAIETGVQNTGIAILILKTAFSAPMSDIACLVPILVACATPLPLAGCYLAHTIINKLKKKKEKSADVLEEVHIHEDTKSKAKECPLRIMGEPINEQKNSTHLGKCPMRNILKLDPATDLLLQKESRPVGIAENRTTCCKSWVQTTMNS